jgi:hypothetical protein
MALHSQCLWDRQSVFQKLVHHQDGFATCHGHECRVANCDETLTLSLCFIFGWNAHAAPRNTRWKYDSGRAASIPLE